ncbi:MAG: MarR family transcriptional regulator [Ktedonobacterales bacterium]|nr:MarR family transcriptional regulator [Ktedonobacterales bacterium]
MSDVSGGAGPRTTPTNERATETFALFRALMRAQQAVRSAAWVELDLSCAQLKTLFALAAEGPATIGQVAERLSVGLPTASHLVERLVRAGLVERTEDPTDRRRALARLTPRAEELTERLFGHIRRLHEWIDALEEDDLAALARGLRALVRVASADE